jgi:hypothetical protein
MWADAPYPVAMSSQLSNKYKHSVYFCAMFERPERKPFPWFMVLLAAFLAAFLLWISLFEQR